MPLKATEKDVYEFFSEAGKVSFYPSNALVLLLLLFFSNVVFVILFCFIYLSAKLVEGAFYHSHNVSFPVAGDYLNHYLQVTSLCNSIISVLI